MTHRSDVNVLWCIKYEPTFFMNYNPQYMGFDETILFDGEANAVGEYTLNDTIEDYNYLEVISNLTTTSGLNNIHNIISKIYVKDIEYGKTNQFLGNFSSTIDRQIIFYFNDETHFNINRNNSK